MNTLRKALLVVTCLAVCSSYAAGTARHVVVVVWDAMRPDFVTEAYAPNLWQVSTGGVTFARHHCVYLSSTEVNGAAISTGAYPRRSGLIANIEYRPAIDPLKPFHTEALDAVRKGDELTGGHYLGGPTIAELVRKAGRKTAVAGAKPVALLADRAIRNQASDGVNLFAGATLPPELAGILSSRLGRFPTETATSPSRNDWTTTALLEVLWAEDIPDFTLLWLNQPDVQQHASGAGSAASLAAIRDSDENLGRILKALDARGARKNTDLLIVSDHGASTVSARGDLAAELTRNRVKATRSFDRKPQTNDVLVVNNGASSLVYVVGHEPKVIEQVLTILREWPLTGVLFTRQPASGAFTLAQAHLDSPDAPDIVVSLRWTADKSTNGVPGMVAMDAIDSGTRAGVRGTHVSLSPFDMHNTLIAAGPDFRPGLVSQTPSGNVDIAPTVLWLLGIEIPKPMDGRVLREAFRGEAPQPQPVSRRLEATNTLGNGIWRQYLIVTEVNGVEYFDEGNGSVNKLPAEK